LIINRGRPGDEKLLSIPPDLFYLGQVLEDEVIREFDIKGKSLLELPECLAVRSLNELLPVFLKTG
jgi:hypothetical protein